jgi:hypothetical protein
MLKEMRIDASGPSELTEEDVDAWIKHSGWTPIEFLTHTYRNPWQKMEARISAAKAVLEYAHRKLPSKVELDMKSRSVVLDAKSLAALSDKELSQLEALLSKAEGSVL